MPSNLAIRSYKSTFWNEHRVDLEIKLGPVA